MTEPVLIEHVTDSFGDYERRWLVEPPPSGTGYHATDDEWNEDYTVRTIRAWRP